MKVRKDAKIGRIWREESEREQGKAIVKRRISSEEQQKTEIQRAPENRLKRRGALGLIRNRKTVEKKSSRTEKKFDQNRKPHENFQNRYIFTSQLLKT